MDRHCLHPLRQNASGVGKSDTCEVLYAYVTYNREPQVVQKGPSEKVCHLGYLGTLSTWVYAGLATVNWIAAAIITLTTAPAYQSALTEKRIRLSRLLENSKRDTCSIHEDLHTSCIEAL